MSRVEILKAIRKCARKLKHNPSRRELRLTARVSEEALHKHFGGLKGALEKADCGPAGRASVSWSPRCCWTGPEWRASWERFPR